ncbi:MAG: Rpn family recombination-promoting nuclease/putative transposase [Cyanobacteriota bacterium]|nr:Rpn family recombination-promoting nuclease/putative transposase [Cyanobacteriota bacterium]
MKFISPKTDFAFKKIFGSNSSHPILISFLNAIIYQEKNIIKSLKIINPYNPGATATIKDTYLDVKAVLDNGSTVIIEMQALNVEDFEKRVVYNFSKAYSNQLDTGEKYSLLQPVIALTITDFVLFKKTKQIINRFTWKEEKELFGYREELKLIFLELPKFNKELSELESLSDKWIYFLKSAPSLEVVPESLEKVSEIDMAFNLANRGKLSKKELDALEKREMFIADRINEIILARREGVEEGIEKGEIKLILRQLKRSLGELSPDIRNQIEQLSVEQLDILGEELLDFNGIEDLQKWLENQTDNN